jgi:hypothetical protein
VLFQMEFTDMFGFLELQDGDREELRQLKKVIHPSLNG